jgi:hypothetical protein
VTSTTLDRREASGTAVLTQDGGALAATAPPPDATAELWALRNARDLSSSGTALVRSRGSLLSATGGNVSPEAATREVGAQRTVPARFDVLQKWEGVVTAVNSETFRARLVDLTGAQPDQEAEVFLNEVSPRDRRRVVQDAIFYWYIGYRDESNGDRERASRIRFRRLPPLTDSEVDAARRAAEALRARLGWH